jgi:LPS-assembly lipoprotein
VASRRLVVLGLGAALAACGFRPLLKQGEADSDVRRQLAAVEVPVLDGRIGYLVRESLLEQLNPAGAQVPSRYLLTVSLRRRTSALGIQLDNTITRYNLSLSARFRLLEDSTRQALYEGLSRRIASFNAIRAPYAELSAEMDAERRAAREVGIDIGTQLAIHFARQEAAPA